MPPTVAQVAPGAHDSRGDRRVRWRAIRGFTRALQAERCIGGGRTEDSVGAPEVAETVAERVAETVADCPVPGRLARRRWSCRDARLTKFGNCLGNSLGNNAGHRGRHGRHPGSRAATGHADRARRPPPEGRTPSARLPHGCDTALQHSCVDCRTPCRRAIGACCCCRDPCRGARTPCQNPCQARGTGHDCATLAGVPQQVGFPGT